MLLDIVEFSGKKWITSKKFHEEVKPTSKVANTNKAIREMPAYGKLVEDGHLLEVDRNYVERLGGSELEPALKANFGNPIMLIDPVAQKEIEHHFEVSVNQAIQSSRENAVLSMFGIDLKAIASDPKTLALMQAISQVTVLEQQQKALKEEQIEQRFQMLELKRSHDNLMLTQGDAQFSSILAYASINKIRVNVADAKEIGKRASKICNDEGINTGEVPDQRYGRVKTYPKEVLEQIFVEYFAKD